MDHKNIIATMMQSFICLGVVGVLWIVVGFSLAFGSDCGQAFCYPMHLYSSFFWRHQGFMCQGKKKATTQNQLVMVWSLSLGWICSIICHQRSTSCSFSYRHLLLHFCCLMESRILWKETWRRKLHWQPVDIPLVSQCERYPSSIIRSHYTSETVCCFPVKICCDHPSAEQTSIV